MKKALQLAAAAAALLSVASSTQANTLSFDFNTIFSANAIAPSGSAPFMTAVFDDGGTAGSVTLTMTISASAAPSDVTGVYFNFDPSLDLSALSFTHVSGSTANGIISGTDCCKADGDGLYDIQFDFPPPTGSDKWTAGQTVVYDITSTDAITASSFSFLSAPGGGAGGPFLAAAHFQNTDPNISGSSAWIGVSTVPLPAAAWLFGSGLLSLTGLARRKRAGSV